MARYGSDKPDLRYGVELTELTEYLRGTAFRVFPARRYVGAVVMPGGAAQAAKELDGWQDWAKARGARGLAYVVVGRGGRRGAGPGGQEPLQAERGGLADAVGAKPGDAVFFAAGHPAEAQELLGAARVEIARRAGLVDETRLGVLLGGRRADVRARSATTTGNEVGWTAVHHPFTSPNAEWIDRFEEAPDQALAYAYDIVCNGNEIGGGSIRIHRGDVQQRVFDLLGITPRRRRTSSASCSRRSSTARRRTAASRSAGTGSACCSPAPTRSARSSPSRRPVAASTR